MLTTEQKATLKAAILADQELAAFYAAGNGNPIAAHFNAPADPQVIVWRDNVTQDEIMQNGFDWTRVDNLSVGPARVWEWMFANETRSINPSKANVRAGVEAVWKGTAADLAVRAAVFAHCKRIATRYEAMFASGTGTTEAPATFGADADGNYIAGELTPSAALEV